MKNVNCMLCGQDDYVVAATKGRFNLPVRNVICKNCGLVYINPCFSEDELKGIYSTTKYLQKYHPDFKSPLYDYAHLWKAKNRIDFIKKHIDFFKLKNRKVLDIGCNVGHLLYLFKKHGFETKGIEPSKEMAAEAKSRFGLDVGNFFIKDAKEKYIGKEDFGLITASHVLEHLSTPKQDLKVIRNLMSNAGYLFVEVPNVITMSEHIYSFFREAHPFSFSRKTLLLLMKEIGYKQIAIDDKCKDLRAIFVKDKPAALKKDDYHKLGDDYNNALRIIEWHKKHDYSLQATIAYALKKGYALSIKTIIKLMLLVFGKNFTDKILFTIKKI